MFSDVPFFLSHKCFSANLIYVIIHVEKTFKTMHCKMCGKRFKKNWESLKTWKKKKRRRWKMVLGQRYRLSDKIKNLNKIRFFKSLIPSLHGTEPGPNSRQALSHQLNKIGSQNVQDVSKTETVSHHDSMDDPWCSSDKSWTKDLVGDNFKVISISEPCRDVSQSRQTFQITDKHVKSWFPPDMNCFKVHRLLEHEDYSLKVHSWNFGRCKPLLPSLASR